MLEKEIEKQILHYLLGRHVFIFKVERQGTFDPTRKCFRRKTGIWKKGVSDLIGIYRKCPIAIEIKSAKGRLTPDQNEFLIEWRSEGGFAFVARSVSDIVTGFAKIDEILNKRGPETEPPEQLP
jgi:penicillin-binding protein-related factor A (putative recombinase)